MNEQETKDITAEITLATSGTGLFHEFATADGTVVKGSTITIVVQHLTSASDFVPGRKRRFSNAGRDIDFLVSMAGFRIVEARNYRGQRVRVVTR